MPALPRRQRSPSAAVASWEAADPVGLCVVVAYHGGRPFAVGLAVIDPSVDGNCWTAYRPIVVVRWDSCCLRRPYWLGHRILALYSQVNPRTTKFHQTGKWVGQLAELIIMSLKWRRVNDCATCCARRPSPAG